MTASGSYEAGAACAFTNPLYQHPIAVLSAGLLSGSAPSGYQPSSSRHKRKTGRKVPSPPALRSAREISPFRQRKCSDPYLCRWLSNRRSRSSPIWRLWIPRLHLYECSRPRETESVGSGLSSVDSQVVDHDAATTVVEPTGFLGRRSQLRIQNRPMFSDRSFWAMK